MPLAQWRTYRERARQKQKALHMLALSAVVRPGHVELRYTTPLTRGGASGTAFGTRTSTTQSALSLASLETPRSVESTRAQRFLQWLCQGLTAPL
jgi:hypothetical protein